MSNPVVHFEIGCRDKSRTEEFYSKMFDWKLAPMGPATMIDTGGIGGHITELGHEPHHYTTFYVQVDDVQAALDKAAELGGKIRCRRSRYRPEPSPWFADLDGNTVGLFKPKRG